MNPYELEILLEILEEYITRQVKRREDALAHAQESHRPLREKESAFKLRMRMLAAIRDKLRLECQ